MCGVVVANLVPLGRVNPEPGESEKRRVVRKVVKRYVLGVLVMRVMQMTLNSVSLARRSAQETS